MKKIGIFLAVCANVFNIYAQNKINGHEYVDLGLRVKWATCNVGANSPEENGDYYAWGETLPKSEYNDENMRTFGEDISDISGNANYDAARANWGGSWRIPTEAEMEELEIKCVWTWTKQNGVNGYKITGPNGNSIFLPAAGYFWSDWHEHYDERGSYWVSTPHYYYITEEREQNTKAYHLYFDSIRLNVGWHNHYGKLSSGFSVRPVTE